MVQRTNPAARHDGDCAVWAFLVCRGLAYDGAAGAQAVLDNMLCELVYDMRSVGCAELPLVGTHLLRQPLVVVTQPEPASLR